MADVPIVFFSGFPRSGSSLAMGLLAQSPHLHCTATNFLCDLIVKVRDSWTGLEAAKAQGIPIVLPRITRMLRGMIASFYEPEIAAGKVIVDKDRFWLSQIDLLEALLERPVKLIVTVRPMADIIASLELLHRQNPLTKPTRTPEQIINGQITADRARQFLAKDSTTGIHLQRWRDALDRGFGDRLLVVPYAKLVADPIGIVKRIHQDLGLAPFLCDPSSVKLAQPEDDSARGLPYHVVRPQVDRTAENRANILPDDVRRWCDDEFDLVNSFAAGNYRNGI